MIIEKKKKKTEKLKKKKGTDREKCEIIRSEIYLEKGFKAL